MSTLTPRMSLKRPDDTDPFLTTDFVSNYNILDAAPGAHICTSTTRPSWGSAQAGRTVFLTDYKCFQYWDGSAWQNERGAAGMFAGGSIFNATISKNTSVTYNLLTISTPRPCTLAIFMNATISCDSRFNQDVYGRIVFDGGDVLLGAYSDALRFTGNSADTSADMKLTMTMLGTVTASAGSHTIGGKITTGTYNTSVVLRGMKTIGMLGIYASNQIL